MNTKLTLNIDKFIVEQAKSYAQKNGKSLSKLIESYLKIIINKPKKDDDIEISDKVKSLMGVIKLPDDFNYKKEMTKAIEEKYK